MSVPAAMAELWMARERLLPFVQLTFPEYRAAPVHKLIALELEAFEAAVARKESPRLMIFMPPRTGKSQLVSRQFPPWVLGRHPDWNVFLVCYGAELAEELSSDARRVVMDDAFGAIFGATYERDAGSTVELDRSSKAVAFWRIAGHRGGLRAVGVGGALTGRGADVLVIDDPVKGRKEADSKSYKDDLWRFYTGTLNPHRLEPGAGVVLMQTRWAMDDLAGRILRLRDEDGDLLDTPIDQWRVLSVQAQAEEGIPDPLKRQPGEWIEGRFSAGQWARIKANVMKTSERDWHAQYQQRPLPEEGSVFRLEWLRFEEPPAGYRGPRYIFADTSYGKTQEGDFSVLQVWQIEPGGTFGLLDQFRGRVQFPELKREARRLYLKHGAWGLVVEDYGSGTSLIQELARESGMRVQPWRPDRDKRSRGYAATDVMGSGVKRVRFPKQAPWLRDLLTEIEEFTGLGDQHDDQVDVMTMALICMGTHDQERRSRLGSENFDFEIVA